MLLTFLNKLLSTLFSAFNKKKLNISQDLLIKAEQGDDKAQLEIAGYYFTQKDNALLPQAVQWFTRSANNQNPDAMFSLATLYYRGIGVKQNLPLAIKWYKKAAELGQLKAIQILTKITHDLLQQKITTNNQPEPTPSQTQLLRQEQLTLYMQQASLGNRVAIVDYINYCAISNIKVDYQQLIQWLYKASEHGDTDAMLDIGNFHANGTPPINQDYYQAMIWFKKSADLNNNKAMNQIASAYLAGKGVPQDTSLAINWFKKAAELNNDKAMVNIGNLYLQGEKIAADHQQAYHWFKKAAELGNSAAMQSLSYLYKNGLGIEKDTEKADYWQQQTQETKY